MTKIVTITFVFVLKFPNVVSLMDIIYLPFYK